MKEKNSKINKIKRIKAREILNSRGIPTIEVALETNLGVFRASVPSGASKGKHEALEIKASKAVKNVNQIIAPKLIGKDPTRQKEIDEIMIKLDGTKNKSKLGANAILAVSIAVLRAGAKAKNLSLWQYISKIIKTKPRLPQPSILFLEGGLHGKSGLDFQEFMVVPKKKTFLMSFHLGEKIYYNFKKILRKNFGERGIKIGYEGGFAPPISNNKEALDFIMEVAKGKDLKISLDCAASQIRKGKYNIDFYQDLIKKYPIIFLEDPFGEDDWSSFQKITKKLGKKTAILGDDLLTTNIERMKKAKKKKACNGTIIKPNQVGTVTETLKAVKLAKSYGWKIMISHRAGDTLDDFIADLAVGTGADYIKAGGPTKKERLAKYNRLLKIEENLHKNN